MNIATGVGVSDMGRSDRNYPVNCWWVGATSAEVADRPVSRWLLDQRVVMYRQQDGGLVALEDRCAHRAAPLSDGKIEGDDLICPYHGFRYNPAGACVDIPSQDKAPRSVKVRAFPSRELAGFVWLWMGDPTLADEKLLPDVPWFADSNFLQISGDMHTACNYMLIHENLLDLTHFAFLHADTLQQNGWDGPPSEVIATDSTVTFKNEVPNAPLAPFLALPMELEAGTIVDRCDWGQFHSPACHFGGIDIQIPAPEAGKRSGYTFRIMHCTTPLSNRKSHYWWAVAQDFGQNIPGIEQVLTDVTLRTFKQDKDVLEAIQETMDRDFRGANGPEISVVSDNAAIRARRMVAAMVRAEIENEPRANR
jgi:phenylpropionate dioxygenase-like ring-hydroxylating dioxygenase large terminal subunit